MFCSRMGNGIPTTCTTTYQKWTGQPIHLAGSKNPLPLGMGSVNRINSYCRQYIYIVKKLDSQGAQDSPRAYLTIQFFVLC